MGRVMSPFGRQMSPFGRQMSPLQKIIFFLEIDFYMIFRKWVPLFTTPIKLVLHPLSGKVGAIFARNFQFTAPPQVHHGAL